jgi:hypothetical protein
VLQLTGEAEVVMEGPEIAAFTGAERLLRIRPRRIVRRRDALPLRWDSRIDGVSPNAELTGDWREAGRRIEAEALAKTWRKMRIARIDQESETIRSLHLVPPTEPCGSA